MTAADPWVGTTVAARILRCDPRTVRRHAHAGHIPHRLNDRGHMEFDRAVLEAMWKDTTTTIAPEAQR